MATPITTRLRFVSAKKPEQLVAFCDLLGRRIQLYGNPIFDGKRWFLWFVPSDDGADIPSRNL